MDKHFHRINPETLFHNWKGIVSAKELSHDFAKLQAETKVLKIFLEEKTRLIQEKEKLIEQKEKLIGEKEKIITDKERVITQKHAQILNIQTSLDTVHNSLGWQALEIIRGYIERLLPVYSRRRYYYDLVIKSIKIMKNQGVRSLYSSAARKLKAKKYTGFKNIQRAGSRIQDPFLTKPVDIVIPVYNAAADFSECIKSVLNTTDLNFHRLIIVDDSSTDPKIKTCLESLREGVGGADVVMLMNERNLGFAKTVNQGMRFSSRDVIILNSDTITSEGWVEKMRRAACSQPGVATVTPFSNNATICSVPIFCENNHLPDGFDLKGFAEFIERISMRHYPQIPTGVGFCMYIKREVLDEVGYFDEQNFQGGYGEENDFCWKASKKGYIHVLDDATFIYHRGGASFTPEVKRAKEDEALRIIDMLHPDYIPAVQKFIHDNPLRYIHEYISLRISLEQEKRQPVLSGY